jgi:endoribonuclease Nob1
MKILVLDTSAFIQGVSSSDQEITLYTTPLVINEIADDLITIRAKNWSETGKLVIQTPDENSLKTIHAISSEMGEEKALSDTDHSVIALAYKLSQQSNQVTIVSDDYGVQNLSDALGLSYTGLATRGIKSRFKWIHYCPGCRREYDKPQPDNICPVCGTDLRRKPEKKSKRRVEE